MKADEWMPLYVAAYLRKTMHLTRDQHGGYFLLIMACWDRGGRLPNDPGQLAGIVKASPAEWRKLAPVLLPFFDIQGADLVHKRVTKEYAKATRLTEVRSSAGKQGGRPPKTESKTKANENQNGLQNETPAYVARPLPSEVPETEEIAAADSASASDWPSGDVRDWRAALIEVSGPGMGDAAKEPGLLTTSAEIVRWRQAGCSWSLDVVPVIQARTLKARASPIRTWSVLTPDVMAARQRRLAPTPDPEETHAGQPAPASREDRRSRDYRDRLARIDAAMATAVEQHAGGPGDQ